MGIRGRIRRDSKHRVLRAGESMRADGKYQFKYHIAGKPHFVYSWKLEPTDKLPAGKKPCLSPVSYTHLDVYKRQIKDGKGLLQCGSNNT